MSNSDTMLRLVVKVAKHLALHVWPQSVGPQPGMLVVEATGMGRADPDAIGWLGGRGQAAWREDGTGPTREVWDVFPLSGRRGYPGGPTRQLSTSYQRWENAAFVAVTDGAVRFAVAMGIDIWVGCDLALKYALEEAAQTRLEAQAWKTRT